MSSPARRFVLILAGAAVPLAAARADEGMWTFDAFPAAKFRAAYGWVPDQAWLDRVRSASVKVGGCSSSFVSRGGLMLTNHHCAVSCLQDVSDKDNDLVANAFTARRGAEEKMCPGLQAEVVTAIRDVTAEVKGGIGSATGEAAVKARTAAISGLEKAGCPDTATTRCQVVALFGGGSTSFIPTANMPTSGWCGRPRVRRRPSAATPTIIISRVLRSMPHSCARMKMAARLRPRSI